MCLCACQGRIENTQSDAGKRFPVDDMRIVLIHRNTRSIVITAVRLKTIEKYKKFALKISTHQTQFKKPATQRYA